MLAAESKMPDWLLAVPWWTWIPVGIAGFYLLPPLLILFTQQMAASPRIDEYDPDATPPPRQVAAYFRDCRTALEACGFRHLSSVALPDPLPNVRAILELFVHDRNRDAALVSAIFGVTPDAPPMQIRYVEFVSEFTRGDIRMIQTNNNFEVGAFADLPSEPTFRFPQISDPQRLYRAHEAILERHAPNTPKTLAVLGRFGGNVVDYLRTQVMRESYERQVAAGYLRYDSDRDCFVPTISGAYRMTWKLMWPAKPLIRRRYRTAGRRLEQELLGSADG